MFIKEIALDLTVFTLSNVNDAISFKPQLCFEVPKQDYQALKENYINFTGTSIRKNRSRLFFLPTNVSDELQKLNPSIPEDAKIVPNDGKVYYKNRLISELDYENVKRVETACAFIAYTALNSFVHFETESAQSRAAGTSYSVGGKGGNHLAHNLLKNESGKDHSNSNGGDDDGSGSASESVCKALKRGNILGFRELGHLVGITPWHFHRVFKVITGLTIREYGQLCVEFIKKNQEIIDTCKNKVEEIRCKQEFSCLDDEDFLKEGGIQYAATDDVVLLHEYFIDPNKSKEFKTRKNNNINNNNNNGNFNNNNVNYNTNHNNNKHESISKNVISNRVDTKSEISYVPNSNYNSIPNNIPNPDMMTNGVQHLVGRRFNSSDHLSSLSHGDEISPTSQRSEIRKRRSSVMHGRMQRAAQNSITSNSMLYECLNPSSQQQQQTSQTLQKSGLKLTDCYIGGNNEVDPKEINDDNDSDTSGNSSIWEPNNNMFSIAQAARSTSPSISSRKNSLISFGSLGGHDIVPKSQTSHKIMKRKSISSGGNLDALQNNMLHRRNKSDGSSLNGLNMDPFQGELSLDSRLSLSPREYPIEFNSDVFGSLQSPASATNLAANEENIIENDNIDFNDGPLDYRLINITDTMTAGTSDTNNPPSMEDISLFDNSLVDQPSDTTNSGINSILDNVSVPLQTPDNEIKNQEIQLDAILSDSNLLYGPGDLTPSATSVLNAMNNTRLVSQLNSMVPASNSNGTVINNPQKIMDSRNFKASPITNGIEPFDSRKDTSIPDSNFLFNPVPNIIDDETGLLFDPNSLLATNDSFLPRDSSSLQRTTTANDRNSNEPSTYDF